TLRSLERGPDQHALELRLRFIEQRPLAVDGMTIGPPGECSCPVGVRGSASNRGCELGWQIFSAHLAARRKDGKSAAQVDELADVAWPAVRTQFRLCLRGQRFGVDTELMRRDLHVVIEKRGDVLRACAQRGQLDANDVEPMIEVLAEQPALHTVL